MNNNTHKNVRTYTCTKSNNNTVEDFITVMMQANPNSVVKNEKGIPLSAYLDFTTGEIVIVEDDDV